MIAVLRRLLVVPATVAASLAAIWSAYLVVISGGALLGLRRRRRSTPADPVTLFRVLIPAHDEEALIADTVAALQAVDYPRDSFEIHVVADNCADRTAELVRAGGATAHERHDTANPGKGPALGWLIDQLPVREGDTDAFVLVDADTVVEPGILRAFDAELQSGAEVVQGHYAVRGDDEGGNVGFRAAALAVRHYVRPLGRTALGGSSGLYGNGMAFHESVARAHRFSDHLVEDIELYVDLLLDGRAVAFAPDAEVRAEMPVDLDDAVTQNQRWEAGRAQVLRAFAPKLAVAAVAGRNGRRWPYLDALLDLSLPPITALVALTAVGGTALRLVARGPLAVFGAVVAVGGVGIQVLHTLFALRLTGAPAAVYRSLLLAPVHIVWKVSMLLRLAIRRGPQDWIRTTRNEEAS
ncbi:MAG: glycosyltransferase family 2 protein [Actinomycetota bacterium]